MLHADAPARLHELDEVPSDRRVALRLLWLLDDPHASLEAITHVVSADPGLSVRILALANRTSSPETGGVTALSRAAIVLGSRAVQAVASTAVLNLFSNRPELPEEFWLHAITSGVAAARVAFQMHLDPAEALTVGLLHDFGEQLLRGRNPESYDEMLCSVAGQPDHVRLDEERALFGIDHAALGSDVLARNGLPAAITDPLRDHHDESANPDPMTRILRVADCIAKIVEGDPTVDVDVALRSSNIEADGERLIEQTETDRRALLQFLAADFQAPRSVRR